MNPPLEPSSQIKGPKMNPSQAASPNRFQTVRLRFLVVLICIISFPSEDNLSNCQNATQTDCRQLNKLNQNHPHPAQSQHTSARQQRFFVRQDSAGLSQLNANSARPQSSGFESAPQSEEFSLAAGSSNQQQNGAQSQSQSQTQPQSQSMAANSVMNPTDRDNKQTAAPVFGAPNRTGVDAPELGAAVEHDQALATPAHLATGDPSNPDANAALQAPHSTTSSSLSSESDRLGAMATTSVSPPTIEAQLSSDSSSKLTPSHALGDSNPLVGERVPKHQAMSRRTDLDSNGDPRASNSLESERAANLAFSKTFNGPAADLRHSISSSPSSISIITPIIGHHNLAADQSSQSMIKPIYVLGNPIGERDYNQATSAASYDQHVQPSQPIEAQQTSGLSSGSFRPRAPKTTEPEPAVSDPRPQSESAATVQAQLGATKKTGGSKLSSEQASQNSPGSSSNSSQADQAQLLYAGAFTAFTDDNSTSTTPLSLLGPADRMSGPSLVYSDGQLTHSNAVPTVTQPSTQPATSNGSQAAPAATSGPQASAQPLAPRLYQSAGVLTGPSGSGAGIFNSNPRRPSLPPPVNQANAASGFRSPMSPSGPLVAAGSANQAAGMLAIQPPLNAASSASQMGSTTTSFYQTSLPPYLGPTSSPLNTNQVFSNRQFMMSQPSVNANQQTQLQAQQQLLGSQVAGASSSALGSSSSGYSGRRPLNITRVEHISAECSNDLIRAVIVFNGTFKGIIYSSGYVNDPTCLYVNGTGTTRYEFSIRLNQCGTLGRQELHQPTSPGEARRRDQVMWNTLTIQYNSIIEQEWDEHFRVSCEYGSDFWKTVSFSPFNVETNTGSPVVFTINPPQCQMDVLLGHGIGPKIAVDGPVTVGDPLTLLIHMKSEKAGYDILVKNCVAHNGGKQRMQLIDSNGDSQRFSSISNKLALPNSISGENLRNQPKGSDDSFDWSDAISSSSSSCWPSDGIQLYSSCVVNERFISPFRGTYNDNDLRHVTLYAYLKAFRFTGSPVLYLECEIHMCQSACPPQMCYWRRLSKRSTEDFEYEYQLNTTDASNSTFDYKPPVISDSVNLFKALQVRQESEPTSAKTTRNVQEVFAEDSEAQLICYRYAEVVSFLVTIGTLLILVCSIAIACCLRVRRLSKRPAKYDSSSVSSTPSLISIGDALSGAGSSIFSHGRNSILDYCGQPKSNCLRSPWNRYNPQQPMKPMFIARKHDFP